MDYSEHRISAHPLFIPVVSLVALMTCLAPVSIGRGAQRDLRLVGAHGLPDTFRVSQNVVTDFWFCGLLAGFMIWKFVAYLYDSG